MGEEPRGGEFEQRDSLHRRAALSIAAVMGMTSFAWAATAKPVLLVVASKMVADPEYLETRAALEKSGIAVEVAGVSMNTATGYGDLKVKPDLIIDDAKAERYEAVVVIGGEGAIHDLWDHPGLRALVIDAEKKGDYVAAICSAPVSLARAGLLKGKQATAYPDENTINEIKKGGAIARPNDAVVVDGKLVTGNGPSASAAFGERLASLLTK